MTPQQIRLVEQTYAQIEPFAAEVGAVFYDRLFEIAPQTRILFPKDMREQQRKFMSVIGQLVKLHLRSLISLPVTHDGNAEAVIPGAGALGKYHEKLGVQPAYYGWMRGALLFALEQKLGRAFTSEVRDAWGAAFDVLATAMTQGKIAAGPHPIFAKADESSPPESEQLGRFFHAMPTPEQENE